MQGVKSWRARFEKEFTIVSGASSIIRKLVKTETLERIARYASDMCRREASAGTVVATCTAGMYIFGRKSNICKSKFTLLVAPDHLIEMRTQGAEKGIRQLRHR